MRFEIDKQIFEKFKGLNIGVVIAKNIDNHKVSEAISKGIRAEEERIRKKINPATLSQEPKIDIWRKAYSSFGAKPKENKCSVENLYSLVLRGINIRHINPLVDIYNLISLKYMLPVGGEDLEKIKGDIKLTFAAANEAPALLLGDKEPRAPHEGEVIYKDDISTICRRWNWREVDRTKLTESTKNCILVIEGLYKDNRKDIESATNELKELVLKECGGDVDSLILDEKNISVKL